MPQNIVLIGFMGSGKSMVSKVLGKTLRRDVVSTDALIEKQEARTINEIFCDSGELYFRKIEKKVIKEVVQKENLIIDTGGGVVLDQENINFLRDNGIVFYLSASPEVIYQRVKEQKHRPLLTGDNPGAKIEELLNDRKAFYEQADYIIETDNKTVEQVVCEILGILSDN